MKWYLTICTIGLAGAVLQYFNMWSALWAIDETKISFIILVLFILESLYIGLKSFRVDYRGATKKLPETAWFLCDSMVNLGFIGTIIGFMLMLVGPFADIDVSNVDSMMDTIAEIALGMGVALTTTLAGMVSSLFMKYQLVQFCEE
jgi:hypothetical protein